MSVRFARDGWTTFSASEIIRSGRSALPSTRGAEREPAFRSCGALPVRAVLGRTRARPGDVLPRRGPGDGRPDAGYRSRPVQGGRQPAAGPTLRATPGRV